MDSLPPELLLQLPLHMPDRTLLSFSLVNKHTYSIARVVLQERHYIHRYQQVDIYYRSSCCPHPIAMVDRIVKDPQVAKYVKKLHWIPQTLRDWRTSRVVGCTRAPNRSRNEVLATIAEHSRLEEPLQRLVRAGIITEADKEGWQASPEQDGFQWPAFIVLYSMLPNLEFVRIRHPLADSTRALSQIARFQRGPSAPGTTLNFPSPTELSVCGTHSDQGVSARDVLLHLMLLPSLRTVTIIRFDDRTLPLRWSQTSELSDKDSDEPTESYSKVQHLKATRCLLTPDLAAGMIRNMPDLISFTLYHRNGFRPYSETANIRDTSEMDMSSCQARRVYYQHLLGLAQTLFRERGLVVFGLNKNLPDRVLRGLLICKPGYQVGEDTWTEDLVDRSNS